MAKNKQLRKRLEKYNKAISTALLQSDPEDSNYMRGYDQALCNVKWALNRMLEDTK